MRIVYLSASGTLGGAERVLLDLLATLRQSEPEWDLRFARWKGHDVFSRAIAELPTAAVVCGYVIGGPTYDSRDSERSTHAAVAPTRICLRAAVLALACSAASP